MVVGRTPFQRSACTRVTRLGLVPSALARASMAAASASPVTRMLAARASPLSRVASAFACASARMALAFALAWVTLHLFTLGVLLQFLDLDFRQHALLDRVQIIGGEFDILQLHAFDDDHRIVFQRLGDGILDRTVQRTALLDRLYRRVTAEHDLDLLVHNRVDDLIDRRVQTAEFRVEIGDLVGRGAQRDADLEISRLLVKGVRVHLVPGIGEGSDADLFDAVDEGHLEAQARLCSADDRSVAQQHGALGLVDRVPAAEYCGDRDDANDRRDNDSPVHEPLLVQKGQCSRHFIHGRYQFIATRVPSSAFRSRWFRPRQGQGPFFMKMRSKASKGRQRS